MFTSKKDDQIEALENKLKALNKEKQSFEKRLGNCQKAFDKKIAELTKTENKMIEMQEYYCTEDARLRRMIASEKRRRINSKNANKRKLRKLTKALEVREFIA